MDEYYSSVTTGLLGASARIAGVVNSVTTVTRVSIPNKSTTSTAECH